MGERSFVRSRVTTVHVPQPFGEIGQRENELMRSARLRTDVSFDTRVTQG